MTDELEPTSPQTPELDAETLARIESNYAEMREFAESLPDSLKVSKHLLHFWAVHIDENNSMEPPQDPLNTQMLSAVVALESRLANAEALINVLLHERS